MQNTKQITILDMGKLSAVAEITPNPDPSTFTARAYYKKAGKSATFYHNPALAAGAIEAWVDSMTEAVHNNSPADLVDEYNAESAN